MWRIWIFDTNEYSKIFISKNDTNEYPNIFVSKKQYKWISEYICIKKMIRIWYEYLYKYLYRKIFEFIRISEYSPHYVLDPLHAPISCCLSATCKRPKQFLNHVKALISEQFVDSWLDTPFAKLGESILQKEKALFHCIQWYCMVFCCIAGYLCVLCISFLREWILKVWEVKSEMKTWFTLFEKWKVK